jgi:lipoprotein-anchoring transpeptidase ErfK/SrfK
MDVDYYSLLTKAVAGKDAAARDRIYKDAYGLIRRSTLSRSEMSSHIAALEDAVRQIEGGFAGDAWREEPPAADVGRLPPTGANWKPLAISASAVIAVIALSAWLYGHLATKEPRGAAAVSAKQSAASAERIVADLAPGTDGGSSAAGLPFALQRQVVFYRTTVVPGSIVVDRESRFLYLIDHNNSARRYGIGITQECLKGGSLFKIASKLEWPDWRTPGADATKSAPASLAASDRPGSPLGSRALLMDKPGLLIHGTNSPQTIGHLVASGCIRLVNDDVEDLYRRVPLDTRVVFVS